MTPSGITYSASYEIGLGHYDLSNKLYFTIFFYRLFPFAVFNLKCKSNLYITVLLVNIRDVIRLN